MSILPWRWKIFRRKKKTPHNMREKTPAGPPKKQKKKVTKRSDAIEAKVTRVNCTHLVPPKQKVRRWHCEMTGREGDCDLFLGKDDNCQYHDPKFVPLSTGEIQEKVWRLKEWQSFVNECISVKICPCDGHVLIPEEDELACPICSFKH